MGSRQQKAAYDKSDVQGDSMTKQELQHFKHHISKALDIGSPGSCVFTFLPEDIQEAGRSRLPRRSYCRSSAPALGAALLEQCRWPAAGCSAADVCCSQGEQA